MELEVDPRATAVWIKIKGRLDTETAPDLDSQLESLIGEGHRHLVFDLEQLEYVSSTGLSSFILAAQKLEPDDGSVVFVALQVFVKRVFDITGLSKVYRICATGDEV